MSPEIALFNAALGLTVFAAGVKLPAANAAGPGLYPEVTVASCGITGQIVGGQSYPSALTAVFTDGIFITPEWYEVDESSGPQMWKPGVYAVSYYPATNSATQGEIYQATFEDPLTTGEAGTCRMLMSHLSHVLHMRHLLHLSHLRHLRNR